MASVEQRSDEASRPPGLQFVHANLNNLQVWLRRYFLLFSALLLSINLIGCIAVIRIVPYTEIDWETYMVQVSLFLQHTERNYANITGPTGPLVYPAAHVYIYSLLHSITSAGENIRLAQCIFAIAHTICLALVLCLYYKTNRLPLYLLPMLFLSRRVLSIFVLRLFNDALQTLPLYGALLLFVYNRWTLGCALYSVAIAVKMNALLYAPGLAVLLCQAVGILPSIRLAATICLSIQLALGAPFLLENPLAYLSRAFELTRQFLFKWSVNGAFLPERIFTHPVLSVVLLIAHLGTLLAFAHFRWTSASSKGLAGLLHPANWSPSPDRRRRLRPTHVLLVLWSCNFIGIAFARTLHYQFYAWYAHSLPFLLWRGPLPTVLKAIIIAVVELAFNVYPPHPLAAILLNIAHISVVFSLFAERRETDDTIYDEKNTHDKTQ